MRLCVRRFSRSQKGFNSMDGIAQDEELSRPPRIFTAAEKRLVKTLRKQGVGNPEIARRIGCSTSTLMWFIREGRFGRLESRQGNSHREGRKHHNLHDSEKDGVLFGTATWKQRQKEIRDGWSVDEARRRQDGDLPCVRDNYHRFRKK